MHIHCLILALLQKYDMGITGAAWATAGAQILGAFVLLIALRRVSKVGRRRCIPPCPVMPVP